MRADRIIFSSDGSACRGVEVTHLLSGRKLVVSSKQVVSACGSMNTPPLLLRSGLGGERNRHVGQNLTLHPVVFAAPVFPEPISPWDGPLLTAVVTEFPGLKLESAPLPPDMVAYILRYRSAEHAKRMLLDSRRTAQWFSIIRDRDSTASVTIDKATGAMRFNYRMGPHDANTMATGLAQLVLLAEAAGAERVEFSLPQFPVLDLNCAGPAARLDAARQFSERLRLEAPRILPRASLSCAHQMSSCRMSASPTTGAVAPSGELYGANNVWVCDASLLPTATGVNPYFSTYALCQHVAHELVAKILNNAKVK